MLERGPGLLRHLRAERRPQLRDVRTRLHESPARGRRGDLQRGGRVHVHRVGVRRPGGPTATATRTTAASTDITGPRPLRILHQRLHGERPGLLGGTCVTGCGARALCSGSCVDTTSNANDCNGCGKRLPEQPSERAADLREQRVLVHVQRRVHRLPQRNEPDVVRRRADVTRATAAGLRSCVPASTTSGAGRGSVLGRRMHARL